MPFSNPITSIDSVNTVVVTVPTSNRDVYYWNGQQGATNTWTPAVTGGTIFTAKAGKTAITWMTASDVLLATFPATSRWSSDMTKKTFITRWAWRYTLQAGIPAGATSVMQYGLISGSVIGLGSAMHRGWGLWFRQIGLTTDNRITLGIRDGSGGGSGPTVQGDAVSTLNSLGNNMWHYFRVEVDENQTRLYINDVLEVTLALGWPLLASQNDVTAGDSICQLNYGVHINEIGQEYLTEVSHTYAA